MRRFLPLLLTAALLGCQPAQKKCTDYVDPTIGSISVLLVPGIPTVQLPNQVIRWNPLRTDQSDDQISNFPLTLTSHRQDHVFGFLPIVAENTDGIWHCEQTWDNEENRPYEYNVELDGCTLQFAPEKKSGIIRICFDSEAEGKHYLRWKTLNPEGNYTVVDNHTIQGMARFKGVTAYCYVVSDAELQDPQFGSNEDKRDLLLTTPADVQTVNIRYAISYISPEQAKQNLENEIPDWNLEAVSERGSKIWEETLGKIRVDGGTEAHKRVFYTAFYRCSERMIDINEYGHYYSAFDHQVHETDKPFYTDNWIWDTHVALEPLQTILNPRMEEEKLNSYVEMYRQCGEMPSFATIFGAWAAMTGNYAATWMADAVSKGLNFDIEDGYAGARHNALECTLLPWQDGEKTELDVFYDEHGYLPALRPGEEETCPKVDTNWEKRQAVAITTAVSYSDWCLALLARHLNKKEDEALFLKRAANYRNVFHPEHKMMWPKDSNGEWIEGIDPRYMDRPYFTENNAYTFTWDVKHDMEGLISLMGGREATEKKLDELFHTDVGMAKFQFYRILPDNTGMIGQFSIGNEPSCHIPYIYNYVGAPWKTQKRIHQVIDSYFNDTFQGLPGDEDGGGMSSFVVFSMMGFFPVTPGIPMYVIGSPFFENIEMQLPDGKTFRVHAKDYNEKNKYIQSAMLNGKELTKPWFTHEELLQGGTLELQMGSKPNKAWGAGRNDAPPSRIDL